MIKNAVIDTLSKKISGDIRLLTPKDERNGDYAINTIHIVQNMKHKKISIDKILKQFSESILFSKVEQKGDFINFYINPIVLLEEMNKIIDQKEDYGKNQHLKGKEIIVEFAHPNTHKLFHIGHLRNISLGESLSRLLTTAGAKIVRVNYQGDVGLHIAKCLYGISKRMGEMSSLKNLDDKIAFLGKTYTEGNRAYETDPEAKETIHKINKQVFRQDPEIKPLWEKTRAWSLEYFDRIYKRIDTKFDRLYFESEVADSGLAITKKALEKGILKRSDGAIIFDGTQYGLDKRVFINSIGLPTYEAKELGLAELEFSEFGQIDKCIHVVGPEQASFFKVTFKVEELIKEKKYKNKQSHFIYGFVDLIGEKMSSRKGNVLTGEWLLNEVKDRVKKTFSVDEKTADIISVGAVKYAFLKVDAKRKIMFDINESISIHGNSGPYLLYTFARCQSVLKKVVKDNKNTTDVTNPANKLAPEEEALLRTFFRFPEVVSDAGEKYASHLVCNYLFDLAQKFNLFYERLPILKAPYNQMLFRTKLTAVTAQIIKNGLYLLGIETVDRI